MTPEQAKVGVRVRTLVAWPLVPAGTAGVIDHDYRTGVMVRWDIPRQGFQPIMDGFSKKDLKYLEVDPKYETEILDRAITKHDDLERRIARNGKSVV